jgi:hypothetical protein
LEKIEVKIYKEIPGTKGHGFEFVETNEVPYPISPDFITYKITSELPRPEINFIGIAVAADKVTAPPPYRLVAHTNGKQLPVHACFGMEGENLFVGKNQKYSTLYISFGPIEKKRPQCK